jgi:hypothetical protein
LEAQLDYARQEQRLRYESATGSSWTGWVGFAAVLLGMVGIFQTIAGVTALVNDEFYAVGKNGLVLEVDYSAWGWAHIVIGALLLIAAGSLFAGHMYGRVIGVIVATLSAIANLLFISAYPAWSVLIIAIDVIVIYAIVVHGSERKAA